MQRVCGTYIWMQHKLRGEIGKPRTPVLKRVLFPNNSIIDYVDEYLFEGPHLLVGEDGANLLARSTPIAFMATGKFWVNNHAHVLGATEKIDLRYLEYFFATLDLEPYVTGSAQPKLNRKNLDRIPIPLPPLAEQRRIAAILDKAVAIRRKRKQAIQYTEELLRATFLDMFGDSEKGFKKRYKDAVFLSLEESIERFIDYRGKTPEKTCSGIPLVTAKIIKNGRIQTPNEFIADDNYDAWMRRGLPQLGDVLFTTEAPLGEVAQIEDSNIALAQRVLLMRGKAGLINNTYLLGALQCSFVRDQIERRSTGSTVKGIRQKELRKVIIPIPPLESQHKYAELVISYQRYSDNLHLVMNETDSLFNSLLQRAFRGEL